MSYEIVPATEALLLEVEAWLDAEEAVYKAGQAAWIDDGYEGDPPPRGFRCNWDSTKKRWREWEGGIDILLVHGEAAGFQGHGIFEIRPDLRRNGYGRILAQFMIARAFDDGWSVFEIGIAPPTAEPFWESMGFTLVPDRPDNGGGTFAFRIIPRTYELGRGVRVPFVVEFFTADEKYSPEPRPFSSFSGLGERLADGRIQLPERAYCFDPLNEVSMNDFVRIEIDGRELHFEKLKRDLSAAIGLERDGGYTYFVDRIRPTS